MKLIDRKQVGRYLLYALGEILLVVIGIIIALQIDEMAENSKKRSLEAAYLNDVLIELRSDLSQIDETISIQKGEHQSLLSCIDIFQSSTIDTTALATKFARSTQSNKTFFPLSGAYSSFISSGSLDIIANKELKSSIVNLYDNYYYRLMYNGEILDKRLDEVILGSSDYFIHETGAFLNLDFSNTNMLSLLNYWARAKRVFVKRAESTKTQIENVITLITEELGDN